MAAKSIFNGTLRILLLCWNWARPQVELGTTKLKLQKNVPITANNARCQYLDAELASFFGPPFASKSKETRYCQAEYEQPWGRGSPRVPWNAWVGRLPNSRRGGVGARLVVGQKMSFSGLLASSTREVPWWSTQSFFAICPPRVGSWCLGAPAQAGTPPPTLSNPVKP